MQTYPGTAEDEIPAQIRMYFSGSGTLNDRKRALLYANIIRHREEDMTGYMDFAREIRAFAVDAIRKKKIDENYAVIYEQFLSKPETGETAELLSQILFTHRLTCDDRRIRQVVVCHLGLKEEEYYPLKDGVSGEKCLEYIPGHACIRRMPASFWRTKNTGALRPLFRTIQLRCCPTGLPQGCAWIWGLGTRG